MNEKYGGLVSNPRNTKDTHVMQSVTRTFGGGAVTTNPVIREEIPAPDLSINPYPIQDGFYAVGAPDTDFPLYPYYIVIKCAVIDNEVYIKVPSESWYYLADPITYEIIPSSETQFDVSAGDAAAIADDIIRQVYTGSNPKYDGVHTEYGEGDVPAQVRGLFTTASIDRHYYNISLSVYPNNAGTVFGEGKFIGFTDVEVNATPNAGYEFVDWYDADNEIKVTTNALYAFCITNDVNLQARFLLIQL